MISIIVPYKNAEGWIARCVRSLRDQDGDLEFIMVNDDSEDGGETVARVEAVGDRRFVFMDNEHDEGVSGARNTGLDEAKGEWVTFLDADDEMLPDFYERAVMVIKADERANIHQVNHLRHYFSTGKIRMKGANHRGTYNSARIPQQFCMVWNKLIRRSLIEDNGIRFVEGMQYGEDEVFCYELLNADDYIHHASTKLVMMMRHFDNRQSLAHVRGEAELIRQIVELTELMQRFDNPKMKAAIRRLLAEHLDSKTYRGVFGE